MNQDSYHIGIRLRDFPKDYIKHLTCKLALTFGIDESYESQIVPHITLLRPFNAKNENKLIRLFGDFLSHEQPPINYKIEGFEVFDNEPPVFYAKISKNLRLEKIIKNLETSLSKEIEYTSQKISLPGEKETNLHVTILSKGTKQLGGRIKDILGDEPFSPIEQLVSRIYLLKNKSILREYDFYLRKSLTRFEAIDPFIFSETKKVIDRKRLNE